MRSTLAVLILMLSMPLAAASLDEAVHQYQQENYEEAQEILIASGPDNLGEPGRRLLGLTYFHTLEREKAMPLLRAALAHNSEDPEVLDALARIQLGVGEGRDALKLARRLAGLQPSEANDLLLARALAANGESAEAQRILERLGRSTSIRMAQESALEHARLLLDRGEVDRARTVASQAEVLRPGSFAAFELRDLIEQANAAPPAGARDQLSIALGVRVDFDDNVLLLPDDPGTFITATDESDTRINLLADVIYRRSLENNLQFFVEGHFKHGELLDLSEFSVSNLRGVVGLGGNYESWGWRVPLELGKEWIDSDSFRDTALISPGVFYRFSDRDLLYGYLRFQDEEFDGFDERPSSDPSGDRKGVGAMYLRQYPEMDGQLRLLGEIANVDSEGRNVIRDEWRVYGYYQWQFAPRWEAGLGAQFLSADYDNVHDVFLRQRDDDVFDLFAHLAYEIDDHWRIRGQLTTGERDSDIDAFDYDRTVVSIGINWNN